VVDAGQKTPTPMSVFNDRECQFSVIAHMLPDVSDDLVAAAVVIVTDRLPFVGFLSGSHQDGPTDTAIKARPIIAGTNAETVTRVPRSVGPLGSIGPLHNHCGSSQQLPHRLLPGGFTQSLRFVTLPP
jgi:hypothetical protein